MAHLIFKDSATPGRVLELKPGVNRVGRNPANDIALDEASISSFHCELTVSNIAISVKDLNSTNGTFINDKQVTSGIIQTEDVLMLGSARFSLRNDEVAISVPELSHEVFPEQTYFDNGEAACFNHPEVLASLKCGKCSNCYCSSCVREIGLKGAEKKAFCLACGGACDPITLKPVNKPKVSFLGRLTETLRLTRH